MKKRVRIAFGIFMWTIAVVYISPLYFIIANALKGYEQVTISPVSFPDPVIWGNFAEAWNGMGYIRAFGNTLVITAGSIIGIVLVCSLGSYMLVRRYQRVSNVIYMLIISMMFVPFQAMMIPLVKIASALHLTNNILGEIIIYIGCGIPMAMFLFYGFIKNVPYELEEAAMIDEAGTWRTFTQIVFPLLKSITITVAILDMLWIWNDFLLPIITISKESMRTLTLSYYFYFGEYVNQWHLALSAVILSIIPAIVFYFFGQKYIIEGIVAGAVKG